MQINYRSSIVLFIVGQLFVGWALHATHGSSRYFPFLQKVEFAVRPSACGYGDVSFFHTTASTAFTTNGAHAGITELLGKYVLQDVVDSLHAVGNPIDPYAQFPDLRDKKMVFKVDGKIKSYGFGLGYEQSIPYTGNHLGIGAYVPFMHVVTTSRYRLSRRASDIYFTQGTPDEVTQKMLDADAARRITHKALELKGNEWSKSGFGDFDLYLRAAMHANYCLMMKRIDLVARAGLLLPTAQHFDNDYPSSVSFGSNGHLGIYLQGWLQLELKQDITVGVQLCGLHQCPHTHKNIRLAVGDEPTVYSALFAPVREKPGRSFTAMPYVTFDNLADGLSFSGRYTYMCHAHDNWQDKRKNHTPPSYLDQAGSLLEDHIDRSRWAMHYVTFHLLYDTAHDQPTDDGYVHVRVFASYDMPIRGRSAVKTHQVNFGLTLTY